MQRATIIICLLGLFISPVWGNPAKRLLIEEDGSVYQFELKEVPSSEVASAEAKLIFKRSIDSGLTFSPAQTIQHFSSEVQAFDVKPTQNNNFALIYQVSGEVLIQAPPLRQPLLLTKQGQNPALAVRGNNLAAAWEYLTETGQLGITVAKTSNQGQSWLPQVNLLITGESLTAPTITFDETGNLQLSCLGYRYKTNENVLYYYAGLSLEATLILTTTDTLTNLGIYNSGSGPIVSWHQENLGHEYNFAAIALHPSQHFGPATPLSLADTLLSFKQLPDNWQAITVKNGASEPSKSLHSQLISFPAPQPIKIISPLNLVVTNAGSPEIIYQQNTQEPVINKFELSTDPLFPPTATWLFDQLSQKVSAESSFKIPVDLSDGTYYLRTGSFNGFAASPVSQPLKFTIDRTPPLVIISSPTDEVSDYRTVKLSLKTNEQCQLTVNGQLISSEAKLPTQGPSSETTYQTAVILNPGHNLFEIMASDEAGNSTKLNKLIKYNSFAPEITLSQPREKEWFKPGSTILVKAVIKDQQNDVEDETEADFFVADQLLEDKLIYDNKTQELSGFINLPKDLPDGPLDAKIRITDLANNTGKATFKLNLDRTPPVIIQSTTQPLFANALGKIKVPISETGAGLDQAGTLFKIASTSIEVTTSLEAGTLVIGTKQLLADGTYEAEIFPRDLIGNMGAAYRGWLIADSQLPQLTLPTSGEIQTEAPTILITGEAHDDYLSSISIFNNGKLVHQLAPLGQQFSKEIVLYPGSNNLDVVALDRAGNETSRHLTVKANFVVSSGSLINSLANGPNPFSANKDGQIYFVYSFSTPVNFKLYVFDLTGTLLWRTELLNASSGSLTWNGIDHFGQPLANGVYPYLLQASAGSNLEIKRGKIIVYQ